MTDQKTHEHVWELVVENGGVLVIDTFSEQYPYACECGAFTHDPTTGEPCQVCAPEDYAKRKDEEIKEAKL